jgi:hypothetical protein
MRTRHVIVVGAALAALAGCGSAGKPTAAPASAPGSGPASAPGSGPASAPAAAPAESVDPATDPGTLDATSAYLTALGQVDKKLVGDTRAALNRGQEVCVDIEERRTDAEQEKNVATRFAVDAAQARKILALTKANLCLE